MPQDYTSVATGRRSLLAIGEEGSGFGRGSDSLVAHDPILPSGGRMMSARIANPAVNRTGVKTRDVQGAMASTYQLQLPLDPVKMLVYGFDFYGYVDKESLHAGAAFRYRFRDGGDNLTPTSFAALSGLPPQHREQLRGIRFEQLVVAAAENQVMQANLTGQASHGSSLSPAEPDVANVGTSRPLIQGHRLRDTSAGDLWVRIERDVAGGGVQFQVLQTVDEVPAWPGAPKVYNAKLDTKGDAVWQWTADQNGADLGKVDRRSKLPIELLFGSAAELAGYSIGDSFLFRRPGTWGTPALAAATPGVAFTLADLKVNARAFGSADPYQELDRRSAAITATSGLLARREGASHYLSALSRTGEYGLQVQVVRTYSDRILHDAYDNDELLDLRIGFERRLLHAESETREGIWWTSPATEVSAHAIPGADAGPVIETSTLQSVSDPTVSAPVELEIITDVDWTPPS